MIDSRQKRMSALCLGCPWRGPLVDATESGFDQGNRQAAAFAYSGIVAATGVRFVVAIQGTYARTLAFLGSYQHTTILEGTLG